MAGPVSTITLSLDNRPAIAALQAYGRALSQEMGNTGRQTGDAAGKIFSFNQAWEAASKVINAVATAVKFAVSAINQVVVATAESDEKLGVFTQTLAVSVKEVSELSAVSRRFGVDQGQLQDGLKGLTKKIQEAAQGSQEAADVFARLQINVHRTDGTLKTSTEVFKEVADRFSHMSNGAEKSAIAMKLMEDGGLKLIPMLNQGSGAINKMGAEFQSLGILASEASVAAGTEFSQNWRTIQLMAEGVVQKLGRELMPAFAQASEAAVQYGAALIKGINWPQVIGFIGHLTEKIGLVTSAVSTLAKPIVFLFDLMSKAVAGFATLIFKAMGVMVDAMEPALRMAEKMARAIGQDGLANDLYDAQVEVRDFAKIAKEGFQGAEEDVMSFSKGVSDFGSGALKVLEDTGEGMTDLGENIRKSSETSTKSVKSTETALGSMKQTAVAGLGKEIPAAAQKTVEILRGPGGVEPAVKSVERAFTDLPEAKMIEVPQKSAGAFNQMERSVEGTVEVLKGLGREVPRTVDALGKVTFSVANMAGTTITSMNGMAKSVSVLRSMGAPSNPVKSYQDLLKSGRGVGGGWADPGFGSISDPIDIDPLTVAYANSGGFATQGLVADLIGGRANPIVGDRFNQFKAGLLDPTASEKYAYENSAYLAKQDEIAARSADIAANAKVNGVGGGMAFVADAEAQVKARAQDLYTNAIPTAMDATIAKNRALIESNNEVASSFEHIKRMAEVANQNLKGNSNVRVDAMGVTHISNPVDVYPIYQEQTKDVTSWTQKSVAWDRLNPSFRYEGKSTNSYGVRSRF